MTDEIMVPMAILGGALLLYVGFFTAMREWIQTRIKGKSAAVEPQGGLPESRSNPRTQPAPGSSPQGPQALA